MRKSEFDFTIPSRQSYIAILMIIIKTWRIIFRQAWPFLIIILVGKGGSNTSKYLAIFIGVVATLGMILAIINFFKYFFYLEGEELIIESGVINRKRLAIPFDRVQTINLEQNILHQIFKVVGLEIDTAGSAKSEFKFDAISRQKAEALQQLILSKKKENLAKQEVEEADTPIQIDQGREIFSLSIVELLKVGITQNHIRSGGLILLFFFWIYQNLEDAGIDVEDYGEEIPTITYTLTIYIFLMGVLILAAFLISLIRTVIKYFNLRLRRIGQGFNIQSGLFTRKDVSALDRKIQIISWGDNLLKRLIGIFDLSIKQASSIAINSKKSIKIPGVDREKIEQIKTMLYGPNSTDSIELHPIDKRFLYRRWMYTSLLLILLGVLGYVVGKPWMMYGSGLMLIYANFISFKKFKKIKWGHNDGLLMITGGTWGDKVSLLPVYKIQAIENTQNYYQQKHQLGTAVVHSAAGSVKIPYITKDQIETLMDQLLYKVEKSKRPWM